MFSLTLHDTNTTRISVAHRRERNMPPSCLTCPFFLHSLDDHYRLSKHARSRCCSSQRPAEQNLPSPNTKALEASCLLPLVGSSGWIRPLPAATGSMLFIQVSMHIRHSTNIQPNISKSVQSNLSLCRPLVLLTPYRHCTLPTLLPLGPFLLFLLPHPIVVGITHRQAAPLLMNILQQKDTVAEPQL